jgi:hypothetical protein
MSRRAAPLGPIFGADNQKNCIDTRFPVEALSLASTKRKSMRTSSQSRFSTSNSSFFAWAKNRLRLSARLGLTALAALALAFAVSASSPKKAVQAKTSTSVAAASYAPSGPSTAVPVTSGPAQSQRFPAPDSLQTILYDQTSNPAANSTVSQNFETANDPFDNQLADDFVVPAGGWTVGQVNVLGVYFNGPGPATDVNVFFYVNAGTLPGAPVAGGTYLNVPITAGAATGAFQIVLPTPLTLAPGTYWVSVQANLNFTPGGEWGWTDRVVTSNSPAAWQNPGGGFGTPCTAWGERGPGCGIDNGNNDQLFQLLTPPVSCPPPTVNGAIDTNDPTQTNRLFRGGVASACGAPNACSTLAGTFHYDAYTYANVSGASQCVTTTLTTACTGTNFIFAGSYLNSFDPNNICTNNIGDPGLSPNGAPVSWSYTVPAGATFVIVVAEVTANAGCSAYTLNTSQNVCGVGTCQPCPPYTTTTGSGVIVPGTTDIGNHCDDCPTPITLPFPFTFYGTTYPAGATVQASSNGSLDFIGSAAPFGTACPLPDSRIDRSILPYQGDLYTINAPTGIFTSVTGTAPNRDFNIEWRAQYFPGTGNANFEIVLHENTQCFDVIYGANDNSGSIEESGVQNGPAGPATQFSCNTATLTAGLKVTYCPNSCPAPVPTAAVSRKVHGGAGTFDINLPLVPIGGAVGIEDRQQGTAGNVILWYNGDFNNVNGLANEQNTNPVTQAAVYDNFNVTNAAGWDITDVFSDNLLSTNVTGATWEIRSGTTLLTTGGTLVASGSTATPTVTPTGRSGFGFTEYQVKVAISPALHLPQLPAGQFYWLNVTPIGDGSGRSFDSSTSGLNAVGTPPGNDQNAFFNSTFFGVTFGSTADQGQPYDFSMGVIGAGPGGGFAHQMVVTFPTSVTVASATVTTGSASVDSFSVAGNVVTINLTGVANAQRVGVTLGNVCDGTIQGNVLIPMGVLAGDTNANGSVNAGDVSQTKAQSGLPVGAGNFRNDVNASGGTINAGDVALVKSKSGTVLPP